MHFRYTYLLAAALPGRFFCLALPGRARTKRPDSENQLSARSGRTFEKTGAR